MSNSRAPFAAVLQFLVVTSTANRLRRQAARLRQPRFVVALLVGLAYFYWIFRMQSGEDAPFAALGGGAELLATLALTAMGLWWWISGGSERALAFKPAEVTHLFTAPLHRRDLVRYRILGAQVQVLFTALFLALFFGRGGSLPWYLRVLSLWALFATLHLHQMGAWRVHASAAGQGRPGLRRMALPLLLFGAMLLTLAATLARGYPAMAAAGDLPGILATAQALLAEPLPRLLLAPVRAVIHPTFAADPAGWLAALPWALLVLALHYVWVMRTDAAFEEAAAEAGRKQAQAVAAVRAGKLGLAQRQLARRKSTVRPTRLPLAAAGAPWRALVWKNLVSFSRLFRPTTAFLVAVGIGLLATLVTVGSDGEADVLLFFAMLCLMGAAMLVFLGAFVVRVDLRQDLERLELLRSLPLGGRALVTGEIAATVTVLTLLQLVLGALGVGALALRTADPEEAAFAALALALAPVVLVLVNSIMVTIQNALALLYPEWAHIGRETPQGIEAMGQNILTMLGALLLGGLALVGPAVLAAVLGGPVFAALGPLAGAIVGGLAFLAGLVVEVVWAVAALGDRFDGLDPSALGILR